MLDGIGDYSEMAMPSGRAAMIERMQAMLGGSESVRIKVLPPEEALVEDIRARHGVRLLHAELRAERLILVLDVEPRILAAERTRLATSTPRTELIDSAAWQTLQRLAEVGLVGFTDARARILHQGTAETADGGSAEMAA